MYYRGAGGFLLPFLAGAVVSPIFLDAFDQNKCPNGNCYPNQMYGYQQYPMYQQYPYPINFYNY